MTCSRCNNSIEKGSKYHRTRLGAHHASCPGPVVGRWYWVRFKAGIDRDWQPCHVRKNNGVEWVALIYSKSHFVVADFEFGGELKR